MKSMTMNDSCYSLAEAEPQFSAALSVSRSENVGGKVLEAP